MEKLLKLSTLFTICLFFSMCSLAQSTHQTVTGKAGAAQITIDYSSPSVRGRKIFGGLEAYGKVWRAGANAVTTFTTDKDILVENKKLPAGTYALFVIPTESTWTVIFNAENSGSGADAEGLSPADFDKKYKAKDVLRVSVTPVKSAQLTERLNYKISSTGFSLNWEYISLPVKIK